LVVWSCGSFFLDFTILKWYVTYQRLMTHVNIFSLILVLAIGMVGITTLMQAYTKYRYRYLLGYGIHLALLNFLILMSVSFSYVFANLLARFTTQTAVIVESGYRFIGAMVLLNSAYALIYSCRELLQKQVSRIFKQSYLRISSGLLLILLFFRSPVDCHSQHLPNFNR